MGIKLKPSKSVLFRKDNMDENQWNVVCTIFNIDPNKTTTIKIPKESIAVEQ